MVKKYFFAIIISLFSTLAIVQAGITPIVVATATPFASFEGTPDTNQEIFSPSRIRFDGEGSYYVSNCYGCQKPVIKKFDKNGNFLWKLDKNGSATGQIAGRMDGGYFFDIAVDKIGNLIVTDPANFRIQKFDKNGNFLLAFGSYGSSNGQFSTPNYVGTDSQNNIYVVDSNNHRIQKFNASGTYLTKWGSYGASNGQFSNPQNIVINQNDEVYVYDNSFRIQKFNASGTYLTKWGSYGASNGQFRYVQDIATDNQNNIYVIDTYTASPRRIQKFNASGTFLSLLSGSYGTNDVMPVSIAIASSSVLWFSDPLLSTISEYALSGTYIATKKSHTEMTAGAGCPTDFAIDSSSSVYILEACSTDNNFANNIAVVIKKISKDGVLQHVYYPVTDSGTTTARFSSLSIDNQDNLYVGGYGSLIEGKYVKKYDKNYQNVLNFGDKGMASSSAYVNAQTGSFLVFGEGAPSHSFAYVNASGTKIATIIQPYSFDKILGIFNGKIYFYNTYNYNDFVGNGRVYSYPMVDGAVYTIDPQDNTANAPFLETWDLLLDATTTSLSDHGNVLNVPEGFMVVNYPDINNESLNIFPGALFSSYSSSGALLYSFPLVDPSNNSKWTGYYRVKRNGNTVAVLDPTNSHSFLYNENDFLSSVYGVPINIPLNSPLSQYVISSGSSFSGGGSGGSATNNLALTQTTKGESYVFGSTKNLALLVNKGKKDIATKSVPILITSNKTIEKTVYKLFDKKTGFFVGSSTPFIATTTTKEAMYVASSSLSFCSLFERTACKKGVYTLATEVSLSGEEKKVFLSDLTLSDKSFSSPLASITRTLTFGSKGVDVSLLQTYLMQNTKVYASSTPSGYFGELTEKAVKELQCTKKIICSGTPSSTGWGVVGKKTKGL